MKLSSHLFTVFFVAAFSTLTMQPVKADAPGLFFGVSGWDAENTGEVQSGSAPVSVDNDVGWRKLDLMLDDVEGVDSDFTLSGPYLGVTLHF